MIKTVLSSERELMSRKQQMPYNIKKLVWGLG
jgi:hypothetical protein